MKMNRMKKLLFFATLAVAALSMSGCIAYSLCRSCTVTVRVYDRNGYTVPDETVYLLYGDATELTKDHAIKTMDTDYAGYAEFRLSELEMTYQEKKAFFALTFKGNDISGKTAFTALQNDRVSVTINQIK